MARQLTITKHLLHSNALVIFPRSTSSSVRILDQRSKSLRRRDTWRTRRGIGKDTQSRIHSRATVWHSCRAFVWSRSLFGTQFPRASHQARSLWQLGASSLKATLHLIRSPIHPHGRRRARHCVGTRRPTSTQMKTSPIAPSVRHRIGSCCTGWRCLHFKLSYAPWTPSLHIILVS
ncbi:hypothetical protein BCR44DRAFT_347169 [Catenaria anguillulae PL171]|uniref:Uncharacterized protein n=1 Tax=Catenaria anguillulae PL171 TaxID=765915 RepID=A0A1Y2H997_9FUNG|nr:hypothetical protein BCR44DRAFT_347169 [Catenaria anguillulae PL171]